MKQTIFINLYRSGVYHRQGKPNTTNLHGGDVYVHELDALESAEPDRGYLTTIRAEVDVPDGMTLLVNPPESVPTPLSVSLRNRDALLPWAVAAAACDTPPCTQDSIETHEGATTLSYEEWRRNRTDSGFQPLPAPLSTAAALALAEH